MTMTKRQNYKFATANISLLARLHKLFTATLKELKNSRVCYTFSDSLYQSVACEFVTCLIRSIIKAETIDRLINVHKVG